MKKFIVIILSLCLSSVAAAKLQVSDMKLSGGLCSKSDSVISVSDDAETFTATFNNFYLEAEDSVEKGHCRLSWKLKGVKGYKVMRLSSYLRAYNFLTRRDRLRIKMESSMAGKPYARLEREKKGPEDDSFMLELKPPRSLWSKCITKNSVAMSINSFFKIVDRDKSGAYVATDSIDHKVEFSNEFFFKSCKEDKSYLIKCPLRIKKKNRLRSLTIFAHAKTKARAIQKARRKHTRKCSKLKFRRKCEKFRRKLCSVEKV